MTASGTTPTDWGGFNWGSAPWGGTTANALPTWTDYITIDGQIVAQRNVQYPLASAWGLQNWGSFNWGAPSGSKWGSFNWGAANWSGNVVSWSYFNLDHLGSVAVITDQGGNVVQRLSYDAWGKPRSPGGGVLSCGSVTSNTTRGYTNQEEMPTQCLVNLNARLYDPSIGKFMAADTLVQDAYSGQSYNRYAYVSNNPLSFSDITGHESITVTADGSGGGGISSDFGASLFESVGASDINATGIGLSAAQADQALTNQRNQQTQSQQQQAVKLQANFPSNSCSRVGSTACGGDYLTSLVVNINSQGELTIAAQFANGTITGAFAYAAGGGQAATSNSGAGGGSSRSLTSGEISLAQANEPNTGDTVDWSDVTLSPCGCSRSYTFGHTVYLDDKLIGIPDFSDPSVSAFDVSTVVHEFVHVWQYVNWGAISYLATASVTHTYSFALSPNTNFNSMNMEQQAMVFQDYYLMMHGYNPILTTNAPSLQTFQSVTSQVRH